MWGQHTGDPSAMGVAQGLRSTQAAVAAGQQVVPKVFLYARTWACPTAALPSHGWAVPMLLSISVSSHLPQNLTMAAAVLSESNLRPCRQGDDGACDNPSHILPVWCHPLCKIDESEQEKLLQLTSGALTNQLAQHPNTAPLNLVNESGGKMGTSEHSVPPSLPSPWACTCVGGPECFYFAKSL